jgi:hypothetical protein
LVIFDHIFPSVFRQIRVQFLQTIIDYTGKGRHVTGFDVKAVSAAEIDLVNNLAIGLEGGTHKIELCKSENIRHTATRDIQDYELVVKTVPMGNETKENILCSFLVQGDKLRDRLDDLLDVNKFSRSIRVGGFKDNPCCKIRYTPDKKRRGRN